MNLVNNLVTIFFIHISFVFGELYKGDKCILKNGKPGICRLITQCSEGMAGIKKGEFPPLCGFDGTQVIVCCSESTLNSRKPGEISKQKCVEYSQYVWTEELNPTLLPNAGSIRRRECPFNRQQLVVGGTRASRREFPHMVQFGYEASNGLRWTCGGSLISERFVLTAAHCLSDRSLGDAKYARMGIVNLEDDDRMQVFNISEIFIHPDYQELSHYNDIGLAKLNKDASLSTWVRPACLYTNRESPWTNVIACGWGKTDFAGYESEILLRVILELYNESSCSKIYKNGTAKLQFGIKDDMMICAGHSKELKDTCQGDSGGPLQVYKNEPNMTCMYDVVGVTSFGKACGLDVNIPAVYTRVSHYTKWIEDIVWPPK